MYKNIKIENFRGISNLEIEDFKMINLFVGKNNCGKTTILEGLFLLIGAANPRLPLTTNLFRGFNVVGEDTWDLFFNKLNSNTKVLITGLMKNPNEKRQLTITPIFWADSVNKFEEMKETYSVPTQKINGLQLKYLIWKEKDKKGKKIITKVFQTPKGVETTPTPKDYISSFNGIFIIPTSFHEDTIRRFHKIKIKKRIDEIVEVLKNIEPSLKDLTLGHDAVIYADINLEKFVPINVLGDGTYRLMCILLAIIEAENGAVLIDEIDDGFYYSSQKILWDSVITAARKYNVQVFATTHSKECVSALSEIVTKSYLNKDNIRLIRIEKDLDRTTAINYDNETLVAAMESEWEVR